MTKTPIPKMDTILLELQYLPCIQYGSKFFQYPQVILEQHENYLKGSYRNRCHIAGPNGLQRLSIPLAKGKNEQQAIREVRIAYHEAWQASHWNSIRTAYGNAPFFDFYADELSPFYQKNYTFLFDFNYELLQMLLEHIAPSSTLQLSTSYQNTSLKEVQDARNSIFPKKHRQKEDVDFKIVEYDQVFQEKNGFIPNLSILDLLFCCGPQASLILESSITVG